MKSAVVFSGGGARGAYEIGVWKALKEIKYIPDIITGTSVGALNGALIAMGEEDLAIKIWENMSMDTVFESKNKKDINAITSVNDFFINLMQIGGIDPKPLKKLVAKIMDEKKIRKSNIEFGMVLTALNPKRKVEKFVDEIEEGKIVDYVLASSACFPIMQKYVIDGEEYIDGGYSDNKPVNMAIKRGAKEIVVVDMSNMFKMRKIEDVNVKVHYIKPKYDLGNFMLFNKETSNRNIELGYLDTMKVFNKLEGNYYTFQKGTIMKSLKYNIEFKNIYKKIFTEIQGVGTFEQMAYEKIFKYIKLYNNSMFEVSSQVLDVLEIAANTYGIDYLKIYSLRSMADAIIKEYNKTLKSDSYKNLKNVLETKGEKNIEEFSNMIKSYDLKIIIAYLVHLLKLPELTIGQKNQILAITIFMPAYLCTAMCISVIENK